MVTASSLPTLSAWIPGTKTPRKNLARLVGKFQIPQPRMLRPPIVIGARGTSGTPHALEASYEISSISLSTHPFQPRRLRVVGWLVKMGWLEPHASLCTSPGPLDHVSRHHHDQIVVPRHYRRDILP